MFPVIKTDNGSEFSPPSAIERNPYDGRLRTNIFYCHPNSPFEKGSCEVNHEFIRSVIPNGKEINYSQEQINLMMSHINSYPRPILNNKTPYELFSLLYGEELLKKLGIQKISKSNLCLKPTLLED